MLFTVTPRSAAAQSNVTAELNGKAIVTEDDLVKWQGHQPCYGADVTSSRKAAFMRLFEARLAEYAMAIGSGPVINDAALKKEADRIDSETQAPEALDCIKKALPGVSYLGIFVRPVLAESMFRTYLMTNRKVQDGPLAKIKKARELLAAKESFASAGAKTGLVYSSRTYTVEDPAGPNAPPSMNPADRWAPWQADFIEKNLKSLKPGEICKEPIETDYNFEMVKLIKGDGKKYFFESLLVNKTSQEDLLKNIKKGKLKVNDAEIKAWLLGIKGNPRLSAVDIE